MAGVVNLQSSSIKLKRHTGSAGVAPGPGQLSEGEFAINLIDSHLYYGGKGGVDISSSLALDNFTTVDTTFISGTRFDIDIPNTTITGNLLISGNLLKSGSTFISGNTFITGDLVVRGTGSFDVFITNYQSSSIIYSSGSTKFGDTQDDTHEFTGSVYITASEFNMDDHFVYKPNSYSLFVSGNITASHDVSASNLHITNISSSGYISASSYVLTSNITASGNISSSGYISASNIFASNNLTLTSISASGDISASGFFYDASATPPSLYVAGDISSSANISASGYVFTNNITASANISASGYISASNIFASNNLTLTSISASGNISASGTISSSLLYTATQATLNSANVLDLTQSRVVFAGVKGELEDDANFTYLSGSDLGFLHVTGNISTNSITSSVAISASHISGSSMDISGNVNVVGTLSASNIQGVANTFYSTKSLSDEPTPVPEHNLETYRVVNFDPNIFITASGTELIIQFGTPLIPTNLAGTLIGFNTDRFSGPDGLGDINNNYIFDDYSVSFTYTLDESNTFISASLLSMSAGEVVEISKSEAGDGSTTNVGLDYTTTFYIDRDSTGYAGGVASGSQHFTSSVHVTIQDGSKQSYNATAVSGTLDKNDPANPGINVTYDFLDSGSGGTPFINNTADNLTDTYIETGATGSITWYATANATSNGWSRTSVSPTSGTPTTTTYGVTTATNLDPLQANWNSNSQGNPSSIQTTEDKTINRIISFRFGAFPSGFFSTDTSPTEAEFQDVFKWCTYPGAESNVINFMKDSKTEIQALSSVFNWTGTKNFYLAWKASNGALTDLTQDGFGSLSFWTQGTAGGYRYCYRTGNVADPAGSSTTVVVTF